MTQYRLYGTNHGSMELPEFLGAFATRAEAEALANRWRVSGIDFFNLYVISMEVGGVEYASFA